MTKASDKPKETAAEATASSSPKLVPHSSSEWQALANALINYMVRAEAKLTALTPSEVQETDSMTLVFVSEMYWRTKSIFDSIVLLLKDRLAAEALILARPLFEESLRLVELERNTRKRASLIWGYMNDGLNDLEAVLKSMPSEIYTSDDRMFIKRRRSELQRYQKVMGVTKGAPFQKDKKEAARKYGRAEDLWIYDLAHKAVHGSEVILLPRRIQGYMEGGVIGLDSRSSAKWVYLTGMFATRSILASAISAHRILNWPVLELEELSKELQGLER